MPALSPTMEHGTLAKWLKKEGDEVKIGEVIAEIETDKATMEVESVEEGKLAKILVKEGTEEVPVNSLIAVLLEEGEKQDEVQGFIDANSAPTKKAAKKQEPSDDKPEDEKNTKKQEKPKETATEQESSAGNDAQITDTKPKDQKRIFASPLAKKMAEIKGISLDNVTGSGPYGRIVKQDILNFSGAKSKVVSRNSEEYTKLPNNNMRKVIAKRLLQSKQEVPHFYLSIECEIDNLMNARAQLNDKIGEDKAKRLSVNDFVIMAAAKALKEVPQANSSWTDEAILLYNNVDISVAVAIDGGLITPIIRNADQKDIFALSKEMKELAKLARDNALKPEQYQGGGFSISNLGMYGIHSFQAIINPPQSCILSIGASAKKPVFVKDELQARTIMQVGLSCDHRAVDGVVGAQFLNAFKKFIESPILMFI